MSEQTGYPTSFDLLTYYQRFELIKNIADSMMSETADIRVAGCCSEIRTVVNYYNREVAPKRGD